MLLKYFYRKVFDMNELVKTYEEVASLYKQIFEAYDIRVWIGALVMVVTYGYLLYLYSKGKIFSKKDNAIKRAKERGNVITAILESESFRERDGEAGHYVGAYEYEYNGKKHREVVVQTHPLPKRANIYYDERTGKIYSPLNNKGDKRKLFLVLIPPLVGVLVMMLLGYRG